jgi:hypothetical protein
VTGRRPARGPFVIFTTLEATMTRLLMIPMLAMLALAGCSKSKEDEALDGIKGFKNKMCACEKDKDPKACAEKVDTEQDAWQEKMRASFKDKPSKSFREKFDKVEDELRECHTKVLGQ